MRRFIVLALLLGLMALLQNLQAASPTVFNPLSLATFGFVLLAAYTLGQVATSVQLPKITGYIVTGLAFGPQVLNIFSTAVEADLRVVNDLAIGLIALSAGGEMHLGGLRRIARSLFWILAIKSLVILASVTAAVFALASFLPFLSDQPVGLVLAVGMIVGVLAIGTSPAATIAVINETGAKGRLADTTLGVAVAKDILMVVLLALGIALAQTFSAEGEGFELAILGELALELALSLLAGGVLGAVIIAYMRYVAAEPWLFVVGIIFAMTAIAQQFHLEALLVFIVAGFVVQNASSLGHDFVELVEKVALPIYVVFFSVAGAGLDLIGLRSVLLVAVALVAVRLLAIFVGTGIATRLADEPEPVRRNAWLSFVAQAGVVIGLSIIVEENLPGLGSEIRTLVMGTVAIHLLLGPILFKVALTRAGEVPQQEVEEGDVEEEVSEGAEIPFGTLPEQLEDPISVLEGEVLEAVRELAAAVESGPFQAAIDVDGWPGQDREQKEEKLARPWSREVSIAVDRFWSEVNRAALATPRQEAVKLEDRWFDAGRWDTSTQRWSKRVRRFRRGVRRLGGAEPALRRTVPVRAMTLYHVDNALAEDLEPVLAHLAAKPALTLRDGLVGQGPAGSEMRGNSGSNGRPTLLEDPPIDALASVIQGRFKKLRRELNSVGTVDLPARRRRPSQLHERAQRARIRTGEAIAAWEDLAGAVVEHEHRRDAIEDLRVGVSEEAGVFEKDLKARFDTALSEPVERARQVVEQAVERVEQLTEVDLEAAEEGILEIGEFVSIGLRRQALAGLRRSFETQPMRGVIRLFDDKLEERLESLPQGFRVVDPEELPDPSRPSRTYPEPASHSFRLIATGAVERTLRPTLAQLGERGGEAIERATRTVQEVRESLELRFDAALDAAIEEGRDSRRPEVEPGERRESLEIASSALRRALGTLDDARQLLETLEEEALETFRGDIGALVERLGDQLDSASPLEARLQAERARVELEGTAVVRLIASRLRRRMRDTLVRLGLRVERDRVGKEGRERKAPRPLEAAGRAGSDRAVLFHILFDDTTLAGKIFDGCLILTIMASIVVLMLESVEPIRLQHGTSIQVLEWLFTLLFTAEYVARLWAVDRPARYALSFFGLVDFLAVIPSYLSLFFPGGQYLMGIRMLRVVRAFRVLKLARYVGEAQALMDALRASRYKITVFLVTVVSVAVVVGSAMYLIEGPASGFTSIPRAVYWSIVTLTTVGFGDITPLTPLGQTLAAILMVLGYGIIAVPTGIVTAEIASRPIRTRSASHCPKCGHAEENVGASYCSVCGAGLDEG